MDRSFSVEFLLLRVAISFWNLLHPWRALRVGRDKRTLLAEGRQLTRIFGAAATESGALARAEVVLAGSERELRLGRASAVLVRSAPATLDFTSRLRNWESAVSVEDEAAARRVIEQIYVRDEPSRSEAAPTRFSQPTRIKYWALGHADRASWCAATDEV